MPRGSSRSTPVMKVIDSVAIFCCTKDVIKGEGVHPNRCPTL